MGDYGVDFCTCQPFGAEICMIGMRLKEERERLGFTQPAFAEIAGAKKRTLIDWEKGISSPTAVQLAALVRAGVDALYVLLGSSNRALTPDLTDNQNGATSHQLTSDEQELLALYRAAPLAGKMAAVGALQGAAAAATQSQQAHKVVIKGGQRVAGRDYNEYGGEKDEDGNAGKR